MLVSRWQAPVVPSPEQAKMIFEAELLEPQEETFAPGTVIPEHRHPFDEVRMVLSGEMLLNISGNQLLLRAGDRIRIPSNTKHSYETNNTPCLCFVAYTTFVV